LLSLARPLPSRFLKAPSCTWNTQSSRDRDGSHGFCLLIISTTGFKPPEKIPSLCQAGFLAFFDRLLRGSACRLYAAARRFCFRSGAVPIIFPAAIRRRPRFFCAGLMPDAAYTDFLDQGCPVSFVQFAMGMVTYNQISSILCFPPLRPFFSTVHISSPSFLESLWKVSRHFLGQPAVRRPSGAACFSRHPPLLHLPLDNHEPDKTIGISQSFTIRPPSHFLRSLDFPSSCSFFASIVKTGRGLFPLAPLFRTVTPKF